MTHDKHGSEEAENGRAASEGEIISGETPSVPVRSRAAMIRSCLVIVLAAMSTITVHAIGTAHAERGATAASAAPGEQHERFETERFATAISLGAIHTCALLDNHTIKCWGGNNGGQLGQGDPYFRGDGPGEMGDNLPPIDLGTGRTPQAVAAGDFSTCALLDGGAVKCWGRNVAGELGQGDTVWRGDHPGEMGDNLPTIDLGTGRTAQAIASNGFSCLSPICPGRGAHTCALLDDGSIKCWGDNTTGALGYGDTSNRGDQPGEMGDQLAAVPLGTGRTAEAVSVGTSHTCALLDDHTVKCWGHNSQGQLGQGDTARRGDDPGEMGDNLAPIDLGTGRTARAIAAGGSHTCAFLDDGTMKCWGGNFSGQLGQGDRVGRGDHPGEMGDNLAPIELGAGRTATAVTASGMSCAVLDDRTAKCWGSNYFGELGQGDANDRGDQPGEMGDNLRPIDLGTGRTASAIVPSGSFNCAVLDDGRVRCWGDNREGQLGQGDLQWRYAVGDQLAPVDLGTGRPPPVFSSIAPVRILDTRDGLGVGTQASTGPAPVAAGTSITIPATALADVPGDADAVVVNLTTTRSAAAGYLTIHPCNQAVPEASNLNYRPGVDTANLAIAPVSSSGTICVYTSATTDLIVDVTGYTTTGYQPNTPTRLADTRRFAPTPAGTVLRVALPLGGGGRVVTVTATRATVAGFLTTYDCTQSRPETSIVNYIPGVDTANLTIVTGTDLCVYTSAGVDIIVDDHGRISGTASESQRLIDTRNGGPPLVPGQTVMIPNSATDGTTRAINITATQAAAAGFFTLHPCNTAAPTTSSLNYAPGRDIANLAIIPTTQDTCITTSTTTHLIIDLAATIS